MSPHRHRPTAPTPTREVESLPRARRSLAGIADQAETALRKASRRVLAGIAVAVVLAVVLSGAAFTVSVSTSRSETAVAAAERVAERVEAGREQLEAANTARVLRGLPLVPDPGPDTNPDLVWLAVARAWQAVDTVDLLGAGGVPAPGVSSPGLSGPFQPPTTTVR